MKLKSRNGLLTWALVIMVVVNLATIGTLLYNRYKSPVPAVVPGKSQTELESAKFSGRYFRERLGLSQEQMKQFAEFNPEFRQQVQKIHAELSALRIQMLEEMSAVTVDTSRLNQLSDSIGSQHALLKKVTFEYFLDLRKVCEPDQQEKLEALFREMFAGDGQMSHEGRGGPYGNQYGRRNRN